MNVLQLAWKELRHRKLAFGLAVLSVAVAVGSLVGALVLLEAHDARTALLVRQKEAETRARMAELEDGMRKAMLRLGFNIVVLPKDQPLDAWHADEIVPSFLPETYISMLATSKIVTVQHLLPILQQKIKWPETRRTIILVGTRGELPGADAKKPMIQPVPADKIILGHELHDSLGLKAGDKLKLMGREFTVHQCYPMRGNKDDITAWIQLSQAQALLQRPGQINAIMALECACAWADLPKVRDEITALLPNTQVIERGSEALARAEARQQVGEEAKAAIGREQAHRARLRQERERLASILVPGLMLAGAAAIMALAFGNVRARRSEIGILRALGVGGGKILGLLLSKAVLAGVIGGLAGAALGWLAGRQLGVRLEGAGNPAAGGGFQPVFLLIALLVAPTLALLASWIPAALAVRQDPANILAEE